MLDQAAKAVAVSYDQNPMPASAAGKTLVGGIQRRWTDR
jgi:hypothetical protein